MGLFLPAPVAWLVAKAHATRRLMSHGAIASAGTGDSPARSAAHFRFPSCTQDFTRTQDFLLQGNSGHSSSLGCVNLRKDLHRHQLHHIPGWGLGPSRAGAMAAVGPRHPADPAGHSAVSPAGADPGGLSAVMAGAGTSAVWRSRAECSQASLARLGTRLWRSVASPCQTLAGRCPGLQDRVPSGKSPCCCSARYQRAWLRLVASEAQTPRRHFQAPRRSSSLHPSFIFKY